MKSKKKLIITFRVVEDDIWSQSLTLDVTGVDQKSLEDIVWSAGLQLIRSITNTPTPVKEGGR